MILRALQIKKILGGMPLDPLTYIHVFPLSFFFFWRKPCIHVCFDFDRMLVTRHVPALIVIQNIWIVVFSHFHLDHCGALPYMSEMVGYDGPIYMTIPTKAICPILLVIFHFIQCIKYDNIYCH